MNTNDSNGSENRAGEVASLRSTACVAPREHKYPGTTKPAEPPTLQARKPHTLPGLIS